MRDFPISHGFQTFASVYHPNEKTYDDCLIPSRLHGIKKYDEARVLCIIERIGKAYDDMDTPDGMHCSIQTGSNGRGAFIETHGRKIFLKDDEEMVGRAMKIHRDAIEEHKDRIESRAIENKRAMELENTQKRNKKNFLDTFKQHKVEFGNIVNNARNRQDVNQFSMIIGNGITIRGSLNHDWSVPHITFISVKGLDTINFIKILCHHFPNKLALIQSNCKVKSEESK